MRTNTETFLQYSQFSIFLTKRQIAVRYWYQHRSDVSICKVPENIKYLRHHCVSMHVQFKINGNGTGYLDTCMDFLREMQCFKNLHKI